MSTSTRWTLAVLAIIAALVVGLNQQLAREPMQSTAGPATQAAQAHRDADTAEALAGPRRRADLPPCPSDGNGAGSARLRDVVVECAADGSDVVVERALAGRTVVLNLWAYWCAPCADELPAMQQYQQRAGDAVAHRGGLAVEAAAMYVDAHIELCGVVRELERLQHFRALGVGLEVFFHRAAVDGDFARAGGEADAGHGGLAAAGAEEFLDWCHRGSGIFSK